ncbi:DUF6207 family protein [Streptomyces sp. NPDC059262]|uniref:DUF6207 family protein n=1 Tax=Streptomyces sp. NPDC059262 TaxID=3346797 RepID=UPI0036A911CF
MARRAAASALSPASGASGVYQRGHLPHRTPHATGRTVRHSPNHRHNHEQRGRPHPLLRRPITTLDNYSRAHISVTIAGADETTVIAFAQSLIRCHNVTGPSPVFRVPGEAGVHVHVYGHTDPVDDEA